MREAYKKTKGFNKKNLSNWDSELFVDMHIIGAKFGIINAFLSGYRIHSESITSSKKLDLEIRSYHRSKFKRIIGRNITIIDFPIRQLLKIVRYSKTPRLLKQRLFRGAIYGKKAKVVRSRIT